MVISDRVDLVKKLMWSVVVVAMQGKNINTCVRVS